MTALSPRISPRLRSCYHVAKSRLVPDGTLPPLPHAAHVLITWRCNLQCTGCSAWQRGRGDELTADQWAAVFAQLRSLDIVKLIGGEPFAREDLGEIIDAIRREINPFVVQLVTNATATDTIARFIESHAWPNLHMRLSLDGLGDTHDRSRGVEGTYARVRETMTVLSELRKKKRFQLAINFTMTDESLEELQELARLCAELNIDLVPGFKVKPFLRNCDLRKEKAETIGVKDRREALERLARAQHGARSGFNLFERAGLQTINRIVFRKHAAGGESLKFKCRELRSLMYLNPYGELITCGLNQDPVGSILNDGFEKVWTSSAAQAARDKVKDCPGCMQGAVEVMSRLYP